MNDKTHAMNQANSQRWSATSIAGLVAALALLNSDNLWAHGYVQTPAARGFLCKQGVNSGCGAIQWEPQSLEALSGFPGAGPADGQIASAGHPQFGALDEQTSTRWAKRDIQAGPNDFTWQFTANHVTRQWRYYLTRQDWNPNQKLSRAAFDPTPFCAVDGGMKQPPMTTTHHCTVPTRTGYQVILAVWEVGDTANSFYNAIDVMFKDGSTPPPATWEGKGTIYPSVDLAAGDQVKTRVFDAAGERPDLETQILIASATEGEANQWPYLLASRINAEQTLLRAGQAAPNGTISPVYGQNTVYARGDSGVSRVEIQVDQAPPAGASVSVSGLQASYPIQNGQASIGFTVQAQGDLDLSFYVYDQAGTAKGFASASLNNQSAAESIAISQPLPGAYQLVVKAVVKGSGAVLQKTYGFNLTGASAYQYVFPDRLSSYTAGTRVLQSKDGRVYECRPFPYSGFCVQWSPGATQFEPGVGSDWQQAWIAR